MIYQTPLLKLVEEKFPEMLDDSIRALLNFQRIGMTDVLERIAKRKDAEREAASALRFEARKYQQALAQYESQRAGLQMEIGPGSALKYQNTVERVTARLTTIAAHDHLIADCAARIPELEAAENTHQENKNRWGLLLEAAKCATGDTLPSMALAEYMGITLDELTELTQKGRDLKADAARWAAQAEHKRKEQYARELDSYFVGNRGMSQHEKNEQEKIAARPARLLEEAKTLDDALILSQRVPIANRAPVDDFIAGKWRPGVVMEALNVLKEQIGEKRSEEHEIIFARLYDHVESFLNRPLSAAHRARRLEDNYEQAIRKMEALEIDAPRKFNTDPDSLLRTLFAWSDIPPEVSDVFKYRTDGKDALRILEAMDRANFNEARMDAYERILDHVQKYPKYLWSVEA